MRKLLILSALIILTVGCNDAKTEESKITTMETQNTQNTLQSELDQRRAAFEQKAPEDTKNAYADGLKAVADSNITSKALQVGDVATNFTLKNAIGNDVSLYDELNKGPVVLLWYRGGWCPYCNMTLHAMQQALPEFKKYGANILALSPEVPDSSITTKEKNELQFEVLSDINNKVAREYKVVYKLTDEVAGMFEQSFGLSKYNGNSDAELPLAVTYIIGQDKKIKYAYLNSDYRNRAEPQDLIDFLKNMKK